MRRGDSVTITEEATVTDASSTCRISADPTMTDSSGTAQQLGEAITPSGDTTYTIVNRVDCSTSLTLLKSVENGYGGTAVPGDWTLSATPSDEDAAGQSVTGSSTPGKDNTLSVQPGLAYTLSESGSVDGYEQTGLTTAAAIAALALIAAGATGLVLRRRRSDNSR